MGLDSGITVMKRMWYCAGAMDTTRSTLHFAERARKVSLTPTVNVTVSATAQLRRLRSANVALQAQLVQPRFAIPQLQAHEYGMCACV